MRLMRSAPIGNTASEEASAVETASNELPIAQMVACLLRDLLLHPYETRVFLSYGRRPAHGCGR